MPSPGVAWDSWYGIPPCWSNNADIMSLRLHLKMAFLRVIKQCGYHESQATPEDGIPPLFDQTMLISWVSGYTWRWHSSVLSNNADIMSLRLHLKMAFLRVIKQCWYHESQATPEMAFLRVIKQCWYHESQATPEYGIPPCYQTDADIMSLRLHLRWHSLCYQTMLISWVSGYMISPITRRKMAFLRVIKQCWYHESQATPEMAFDNTEECHLPSLRLMIQHCFKQCWYHESQATPEMAFLHCYQTMLISWVSGYTWRWHSSMLSNNADIMSLRLHLKMAFSRCIKQSDIMSRQATPEDGIPPCYQTMHDIMSLRLHLEMAFLRVIKQSDIMSLRLHLKMAFLRCYQTMLISWVQATPEDGIPQVLSNMISCLITLMPSGVWVMISGYTWRWHSSGVIKQCWYHESQATPEDGIPQVLSNNADIMSLRLHLKMAFLRVIKQCWYHESQATPEDGIFRCSPRLMISIVW